MSFVKHYQFVYVLLSPLGFEGRVWDLIVLYVVPRSLSLPVFLLWGLLYVVPRSLSLPVFLLWGLLYVVPRSLSLPVYLLWGLLYVVPRSLSLPVFLLWGLLYVVPRSLSLPVFLLWRFLLSDFLADDIVLFAESEEELQSSTPLNYFCKFCNEWKLTINPEKSKIIIFGERAWRNHNITINDKIIEEVDTVKYLGVFFF